MRSLQACYALGDMGTMSRAALMCSARGRGTRIHSTVFLEGKLGQVRPGELDTVRLHTKPSAHVVSPNTLAPAPAE